MRYKLTVHRNDEAQNGRGGEFVASRHVEDSIVSLGSDAAATLRLTGPGVAAEHALFLSESDALLLITRGDGTELNGESLPREAQRLLSAGDRLRIGEYAVSVELEQSEELVEALAVEDERQPPAVVPLTVMAAEEELAATAVVVAEEPPRRNFAALMDSLRTDEDHFYFLVEGGAQHGARVRLDQVEMPLGWGVGGGVVCFEAATIATTCAVVRNDWSGVVVQPSDAQALAVNGEGVVEPRRLRDGDRLQLLPPREDAPVVVFHEPASLIVLDSLLPRRAATNVAASAVAVAAPPAEQEERPPTMAAAELPGASPAAGDAATLAARPMTDVERLQQQRAALFQPRYFGKTFSSVDLVVFALGTVIATIVVYLILKLTS